MTCRASPLLGQAARLDHAVGTGIFLSTVAMALTSSDANLQVTALSAVLLAFWTTTLEVAADACVGSSWRSPPSSRGRWWRELGLSQRDGRCRQRQIYIARMSDWTTAYLVIAAAAFLPFPSSPACGLIPTQAARYQRW